MAVVDYVAAASIDDASMMRRLAAMPDVDYVLHDRTVSASKLILGPAIHPSFSVVLGPVPVTVHPIGPATGHDPDSSLTPVPPAPPAPPTDIFYNSPQGWAVRQAGGYGNNVPGGPAHGPWDTTMGKGVRIAILDSGVDATHPDIAPNLALNITEVSQDPQTGLPSSCDDGSPQDQTGHGTWTASLAAAAQGPGTETSSASLPPPRSSTSKSSSEFPAPLPVSISRRNAQVVRPPDCLAGSSRASRTP